jgi:orotate phosphoribosyltransferase
MDVLPLFEATGAYLKGHFRLTSGLHSPRYLQCAKVLQHPAYAEQLGQALANRLKALTAETEIGLVVSPAMGGLIIGHEVARALGTPFLFTERGPETRMNLRRGFTVDPGVAVAVVEDVVTTGGSTREVIELLRQLGARTVAAGSIIDRSGGSVAISSLALAGVPFQALCTLQVETYPPESCPLCAAGSPVTKPGSRPSASN